MAANDGNKAEELWNQLQSLTDITENDLVISNFSNPTFAHCSVHVGIATTGMAGSQTYANDPTKAEDFYLVSHAFTLTPKLDQLPDTGGVHHYYITVSTCDGQDAKDPAGVVPLENVQSPASNIVVATYSPETTEGATTVSSTVGWNFGGNLGFFGATPQGGVSGGVDVSHSTSYQIPDVGIESTKISENSIQYTFSINTNDGVAVSSFEPVISHVFHCPDPLVFSQESRSIKPSDAKTAPVIAFQIEVRVHLVDHSSNWGTFDFGSTKHLIFMRVPPLPDGVVAHGKPGA